MHHLAGLGVSFAEFIRTGAHALSVRAVAEGRADIAGIDAMTWELLKAHDPVAGALREIGRTPAVPGLPYITALARDPARIADAVAKAIPDLPPETRAALHLQGLVEIPAEAYLAVPTPPAPPG